jgi:ABC-type sugar transport system substrate-binding protein
LAALPAGTSKSGVIANWLRGALAAAVLVASGPAAWSGNIRVGFIDPTGPPEFWRLVVATMQAAAAELGIDLDTR